MKLGDEAHVLEEIVIVVQRHGVRAQGNGGSALLEPGHRGDPALELKVGAGIVADLRAGLGQDVDVAVGEPDGVGERDVGAQVAEVLEVGHGRLTVSPPRVLSLIEGLQEMHVNDQPVVGDVGPNVPQRLVWAPLDVGRAQADTQTRLARSAER